MSEIRQFTIYGPDGYVEHFETDGDLDAYFRDEPVSRATRFFGYRFCLTLGTLGGGWIAYGWGLTATVVFAAAMALVTLGMLGHDVWRYERDAS